ncbi:MAG: methyltransferase [Actinobacteria bacterium]|nr:methyltransferase [Actinomycetota bacterium]
MAEAGPRTGASSDLPDPAVVRALGAACGLDLEAFRPAHVTRTIDRAVERLGLRGPGALAPAVAADARLRARFRRAVAVSTSGMWRDPQQFDLLDRLIGADHADRRPPRVWSVGASDGSELCSLALLLEGLGRLDGAVLLGSDLLPENVALARERCRERCRERLTPAQLSTLRFEERDVVRSAPTGSWDVVLCRNVLIHLAPDAKRAMLDHVTGAVAPGGLLLLGRSERLPRDERRGLADAGQNAYRRCA